MFNFFLVRITLANRFIFSLFLIPLDFLTLIKWTAYQVKDFLSAHVYVFTTQSIRLMRFVFWILIRCSPAIQKRILLTRALMYDVFTISFLLMITVSQYYRGIFIDFILLIETALEIAPRNSAEDWTPCFFLRFLCDYCQSINIFLLVSESDLEALFSFPLFHLGVIISID